MGQQTAKNKKKFNACLKQYKLMELYNLWWEKVRVCLSHAVFQTADTKALMSLCQINDVAATLSVKQKQQVMLASIQ